MRTRATVDCALRARRGRGSPLGIELARADRLEHSRQLGIDGLALEEALDEAQLLDARDRDRVNPTRARKGALRIARGASTHPPTRAWGPLLLQFSHLVELGGGGLDDMTLYLLSTLGKSSRAARELTRHARVWARGGAPKVHP